MGQRYVCIHHPIVVVPLVAHPAQVLKQYLDVFALALEHSFQQLLVVVYQIEPSDYGTDVVVGYRQGLYCFDQFLVNLDIVN